MIEIRATGPIRIDVDDKGRVVIAWDSGEICLEPELASRLATQVERCAELSRQGVRSTQDGPHKIVAPPLRVIDGGRS